LGAAAHDRPLVQVWALFGEMNDGLPWLSVAFDGVLGRLDALEWAQVKLLSKRQGRYQIPQQKIQPSNLTELIFE
jgi:hypothetical protein